MAAENGGKRAQEDVEENGSPVKRAKVEEPAGVLLFCGVSDYDQRNDAKLGKHPCVKWSPHRFEALEDVRIKSVSTSPVAYHFLAVADSGDVYSWGFNKNGQLGHGDMMNHRNPEVVKSLSGHTVVSVATGRFHSLFLTDEGKVFACGKNDCGQLGIGKKQESVSTPTLVAYKGDDIVQIACGDAFSLLLNAEGVIYACGTPEHGQLGNGSEGKQIEKRKEVFAYEYSPIPLTSFIEKDDGDVISHGQPHFKKIACGPNHSVAIDDQQRLFTWGFGGYGRLGHNDTKNEMTPRLMKCWYRITGRADGGVVNVYPGGQFNLVETITQKCTYMFGQQRLNAEANMYPKPVDDLMGWNVSRMACSQTGWICAADDSIIASQPSPCYGTLGMGEKKKSSAAPTLITTLKDIRCIGVGMGYMHALYIVRDETPKDKAAIDKFPTMKF